MLSNYVKGTFCQIIFKNFTAFSHRIARKIIKITCNRLKGYSTREYISTHKSLVISQ